MLPYRAILKPNLKAKTAWVSISSSALIRRDLQSRAGLSRANSNEVLEKPAVDPLHKKKPSRATVQHRFKAFDFSESELKQLMKCICCDERWTTRESA